MAATVLLSACASGGTPETEAASLQPLPAAEAIDWRSIATDDDRTRIRQWRNAWMRGLARARASGHAAELEREGRLLEPDAAVAWQEPPPGDYLCRTIKVGGKGDGMLDYVAYPAFACRVRNENGLISFAKLTGSQRPLGLFLPDTNRRMVFLGTLQLGDERRALQYGHDRERDMAAVVERIDERRWRVVFPYPHFESLVDVLELVPRGSPS